MYKYNSIHTQLLQTQNIMASNDTKIAAQQTADLQGHEQGHEPVLHLIELKEQLTPGHYMKEYYNQDGDRIRRLGMMINLYISKEILDIEFNLFVSGHKTKTFIPKVVGGDGRFRDSRPVKYGEGCYSVLVNLVLRGGPITMDDMIHGMATKKIGRLILSQYVTPPAIPGYEKIMIKDYYVTADGILSATPPNICNLKFIYIWVSFRENEKWLYV